MKTHDKDTKQYKSTNSSIKMNKIIKQKFNITYAYDIFFTKNIFNKKNKLLINILNKENKVKKNIIIFIDKNVYIKNNNLIFDIKNYFNAYKNFFNLKSNPIILSGGEKVKNHPIIVNLLYKIIDKYKICRKSYIFVIGGGSFQDLLGFVAATAHRGIKLIRIPTTTLSQDDSGVGVKNGINFLNKKNFIGSFNVPFAVINDYNFLKSLDDKNYFEGFSEIIKVSLIKDKSFFSFIEKNTDNIIKKKEKIIEKIIYKSAKLHAYHISKNGDPFENLSSRPLDFGHWAAHKLEKISKHKISHGAAVAIGIALDSTYSYFVKMITRIELKRILTTLINLNLKIFDKNLLLRNEKKFVIFDGLEEFREHLGGKLTISLLKKIGTKIDVNHVNIKIYLKSLRLLKYINYKNEKKNKKIQFNVLF